MTTPCNLRGLGNVLLDLVLTVSEAEFNSLRLPVPRGQVMRMTSAEQTALLSRFPAERIHRYPGGSCANVLRAFAWHGHPAKLLGLAGDDEAADFLFQSFQTAGVDTSGIQRLSGHTTDCCLALVTPDGERTMLPCFDAGAQANADSFQGTDIDGYDHLHLEGYNLRFPSMLESVLALAKARGLRFSWDLGDVSLVNAHRSKLQTLFRANPLACLFANQSEAQSFVGSNDAATAAAALAEFAECAVVTANADGAWVAVRNTPPMHIPAVPPPRIVDTVGAGDSFQGTFLASYYSGSPPDEAARRASSFASRVIALPGATMPPMAPQAENNVKAIPVQSVL